MKQPSRLRNRRIESFELETAPAKPAGLMQCQVELPEAYAGYFHRPQSSVDLVIPKATLMGHSDRVVQFVSA